MTAARGAGSPLQVRMKTNMSRPGGVTTSYWAVEPRLVRPSLQRRVSSERICVIGACIAGLSVTYELAAAGKSVIVIDADEPGGGETARTTAHLTTAFDNRYVHVERHLGGQAARVVAESHAAAIDQVDAICRAEAIDCGFDAWMGAAMPCAAGRGTIMATRLVTAWRFRPRLSKDVPADLVK